MELLGVSVKYSVHEDFRQLNINLPISVILLPLLKSLTRGSFAFRGIPPVIVHSKVRLEGYKKGNFSIEIFHPSENHVCRPVLLFLHGGAFALPASAYHKRLICDYAIKSECSVVFVDYRLAPRFPYPYGLEDCFSAYRWIIRNAGEFGFDTEKIGICGDSAGGNLAASLIQLLTDREYPMPLFQMLIYPVLDSEMSSDSMKKYPDSPVWNSVLNRKMWNLYLKNRNRSIDLSYSSPITAENLEGFPETYIEVNEFDCLLDEGRQYADRLKKAGINTVLYENRGAVHGFELNYESSYTQAVIDRRIRFFREKFYGENRFVNPAAAQSVKRENMRNDS